MHDVLHLEDYRGRRRRRRRRAVALYQADPERARLVRHLDEVVSLLGAERAAVLWVDEYGSGLVHVHTLLDLACDEPRREFALAPLRNAWDQGVPGLHDIPDVARTECTILPGRPGSFCAVALGSDGGRSWFLTADARSPRRPLGVEETDRLLFLAGECSAVVLHQDLAEEGTPRNQSFELLRRERFSGWPVLRDVEDRDGKDPVLASRITCRFLVTRLLRTLVDDDFNVSDELLASQIEGSREEFERSEVAQDPERPFWEEIVDAAEAGDRTGLASAAVALGDRVEWEGHLHGARELYRLAYDIAVVAQDSGVAVDAARFVGRSCRKLSDWDDAFHWYEVALGIAREEGLRAKEAAVLDGLGNTYRERGNFPRARESYEGALAIGEEIGDPWAVGSAHQNLAVLEKHAARTDEAIRHAWGAVLSYEEDAWRLRALGELAGIFLAARALEAAEEAYTVVAGRSDQIDAKAVALNALAHISALRKDEAEFDERVNRAQGTPLGQVSNAVRLDILLYRTRSFLCLGREEDARRTLKAARALATRCELYRGIFAVEELFETMEGSQGDGDGEGPAADVALGSELPAASVETLREVQRPLGRMSETMTP